jgi:hypothetical protein
VAWDPGTTVLDSSRADTDEMASVYFLEFTLGMLRIGCLEEWSFEELTEFVQLMIVWLIRGSRVDSCVSTLQINVMSRGCFTSYSLVWDPSDFTTYRQVQERFTWRDFVDEELGYFLDDVWMIAVGWRCLSIMDFPFDTWKLGVVDALSVCDLVDSSWLSDFRIGLVDFTEIHWQGMILDSGDNSLRHYSLGLQEWRMQSRKEDRIFMIRVAQCQHVGSFLVIAQDPGILWVDSLVAGTYGKTNGYFQEPFYMEQWIGFLGGIFYEGLTESSQYRIAPLIKGLRKASCVSTLQDFIMGGRCSTTFRLVWDPGDHY